MEQQRLARLADTKKALDEKRRTKAAESARTGQTKAARGSVQGTTQEAEARPAARAKTREGVSKTKISKNKSAT